MPGQAGTGTFNVRDLVFGEPAGSEQPTNIIPQGGSFDLSLTFEGSGSNWKNMVKNGLAYEVWYHLEGIGNSEDEVDYGPVTKNLVSGKLTYTGADTRRTISPNNLKPGLYLVAGVVIFPTWPGTTGFTTDTQLQVYVP